MRKDELTSTYLINGWLERYHGIDIDELCKKEPELVKTPDWWKKYPVTSKQHDEWYQWCIDKICEAHRCSRKHAKRNFAFDYLNIAPSVASLNETK